MLTVSTFSTTATQSNLPGTGRVLGLAYDAIGQMIEKKLNKVASKLERGPNATAQKIVRKEQRIREKRWHPSTSEYIEDLPDIVAVKDRKALAALCKRLLKYTKSVFGFVVFRALLMNSFKIACVVHETAGLNEDNQSYLTRTLFPYPSLGPRRCDHTKRGTLRSHRVP